MKRQKKSDAAALLRAHAWLSELDRLVFFKMATAFNNAVGHVVIIRDSPMPLSKKNVNEAIVQVTCLKKERGCYFYAFTSLKRFALMFSFFFKNLRRT